MTIAGWYSLGVSCITGSSKGDEFDLLRIGIWGTSELSGPAKWSGVGGSTGCKSGDTNGELV